MIRLATIVMLVCIPVLVHAGWLDSVIENTGKSLSKRAIEETGNAAYDSTKKGARGSVSTTDKKNSPSANNTSSPDNVDAMPDRRKSSKYAENNREQADGDEEQTTPEDLNTGTVYGNKFDFIPGEKVILFEDFSDVDAGEYPSRWTPGEAGGPMEVVEYKGKNWMKATQEGNRKDMRTANFFMRFDPKKSLPDKFTVEFDTPATTDICLIITDKHWATGQDNFCYGPGYAKLQWANQENKGISKAKGATRHASVAVSGTNLKAYLDGERVIMHPDAIRGERNTKVLKNIGFWFPDGKIRHDQMVTNIRLAEGGKDYKKELVSGRIITHGITFDTGSDKIRPESGPTLRKILKIMQDNEEIRFEVQGHTDNQGSKKTNQPLSERRAAAVKEWLINQGIVANRLKSAGFGDSKSIDSNESAEGKANNRRVEFVKL